MLGRGMRRTHLLIALVALWIQTCTCIATTPKAASSINRPWIVLWRSRPLQASTNRAENEINPRSANNDNDNDISDNDRDISNSNSNSSDKRPLQPFFSVITTSPRESFQRMNKSVRHSINAFKDNTQQNQKKDEKIKPPAEDQYLQKTLKASASAIIGKREPYEFGDMTRWLNMQAKSKLQSSTLSSAQQPAPPMTSSSESRKPGSMFSTFLQMVRSLLLVHIIKCVVQLQVESQVLRYLPVRVLIDILIVCLEQETRPKVIRLVGTELDKRLKRAVVGDENYQFGDLTKLAVSGFTGKQSYQFGDITRSLLEKAKAPTYKLSNEGRYKEEVEQELTVLEKDVANEYQFGDLTKRAVSTFTGKKSYQFGDIARTVLEKVNTESDKLLNNRVSDDSEKRVLKSAPTPSNKERSRWPRMPLRFRLNR